MKIESRFFAATDVLVCSEAGESNGFDRLSPFCFGNYVIPSAVGKANVAQDDIEFLGLHYFQSALSVIGNENLMSEMTEQARQSPPRISVIFHQQNAQRLCRFLLTLRTHANLFGALRHCVKFTALLLEYQKSCWIRNVSAQT